MSLGIIARDEHSAPFFDAAARGDLLIHRCDTCGAHSEPAAKRCQQCDAAQLGWVVADGTGEIVSWITLPGRTRQGHVPTPETVIALVELAEGPWLTVQVQGIAPEAVHTAIPVRIDFTQPDGGEPIPVAKPAQ